MKKTAIVSCYFIHNYGSMLQAYATQKILDDMHIENETINVNGFLHQFRKAQYSYIIKMGVNSEIFRDKVGKAKNLFVKKFIKNSYTDNIGVRDKKFEEFAEKYIRKSEIHNSIEELTEVCRQNYDTVLIGSDQLWLPANIAANYYTLNFVPEGINKVAYATSFGVSSLPNNILCITKEFLKKIDHLSVREQTGQNLIKSLIDRNVPVVCDPTLLLSADIWSNILPKESIIKEKFIFCYFIGNCKKHREFAIRLKDIQKNLHNLLIVVLIHYLK